MTVLTLLPAVPTGRARPQTRTRAATVISEGCTQWNRLRIESPLSACAGVCWTSDSRKPHYKTQLTDTDCF